jgi:hypothetical protein
VADPWTDDLAALGTHTRSGLRSLAITRAECVHHERKPMRFFKQHPALAALLVLAILGIAAPVAYAIVDRVFLSIDVNKSESEIEADVQAQLQAAGKTGTVTATKGNHEYEVAIESDDPSLGNLDLEIVGPNDTKYQLHLEIPPTLPEAQQTAVGEAASKAIQRPNGETDAEMEKAIIDDLAKQGVRDVVVKVRGTAISIVVRQR